MSRCKMHPPHLHDHCASFAIYDDTECVGFVFFFCVIMSWQWWTWWWYTETECDRWLVCAHQRQQYRKMCILYARDGCFEWIYGIVVVSCSSGPQNRCRFAVIYKHFEYKMLVGHIMWCAATVATSNEVDGAQSQSVYFVVIVVVLHFFWSTETVF